MRILRCVRSIAGGLAVTVLAFIATTAFWVVGTEPAHAIPSPELVVGSFVSISQLFALASAVLGGGAAFATMRVRRRGGSAQMSKSLMYTALGMFAVMCVSIGVNIWQYVTDSNARQERLEATLTRPMPKLDGKSLDPTLKEVSYGEQQRSPRGISTDDLEKLLEAKARGERQDTFLLDIRETAETEMGTMPGAKMVRFPDIKSSNIDFANKTAILFCHNGNRGYETCQELSKLGIDCRFLVGGLEKWLVEKRPLTGLNARTLDDLRAVPTHRNQGVLLDTPQVHELVDKEGAVFVDARYPGEFASGALPNAINLPVRPTPTAEFKTRLSQLPKKPIIVPCYDRRSCFFGEVLGLELDRAGYDFRGRYTLPWEYFIAERAAALHQGVAGGGPQGLFRQGCRGARRRAVAASPTIIGLVLAIVLLACVSRLMVLPFSLKAERDQIRARAARSRDGRHQAAAEGRSGAQDAGDPRLLQAPRHDARPQPDRHAVPADHGGGTAGGAASRRHGQCPDGMAAWTCRPRPVPDPAACLRRADHGLSRHGLRHLAHQADRDLAGGVAGADRDGRDPRAPAATSTWSPARRCWWCSGCG